MNNIKKYALFLVLVILTSCSSGYEVSENLKKIIQQKNIEQITIQLNQQEKQFASKDVRFSDQFLMVDNAVYNLSTVKTYYNNGKEMVIVL